MEVRNLSKQALHILAVFSGDYKSWEVVLQF